MNNKTVFTKEQKDDIKKILPANLTKIETEQFLTLSESLGANPLKREIWALKYNESPASFICGRDFYRRKAQELTEYDGHHCDAVYSNDTFEVNTGNATHVYRLGDRGSLLGAYCIVSRKNCSIKFYVFVSLKEYINSKPIWRTIPETMIKKVAEAQALRGAFQGVFAGTYTEAEQWEDSDPIAKSTIDIETIKQEFTTCQNDNDFKMLYKQYKNEVDSSQELLEFLKDLRSTK